MSDENEMVEVNKEAQTSTELRAQLAIVTKERDELREDTRRRIGLLEGRVLGLHQRVAKLERNT